MADKSSLEPHPLGSNQGVPTAIFAYKTLPTNESPQVQTTPTSTWELRPGYQWCLLALLSSTPASVIILLSLPCSEIRLGKPRPLAIFPPGRSLAGPPGCKSPPHTPCSRARCVALVTADREEKKKSSIPGAETRGREPPRLPCCLLFKFGNHEGAWLWQPRLRHHPETSVAPGEESSWCPKLNPW